MSVCKAFLIGITCAEREKANKMKIKVAVSGFIDGILTLTIAIYNRIF
jgi:hypothetical protein